MTELTSLQFDDFEVSCAVGVGAGAFVLGTEDGGIRFFNESWKQHSAMKNAVMSGEAINGVAMIGQFVAASSRDDVWIWTLPQGGGKKLFGAHFPVGAHGIIAATNGYFVAPLGLQGIMLCKPKKGEAQGVTITGGNPQVYVYRVVSQQAPDGQHLLACALRRHGVGILDFADGEVNKTLHTKTFSGLDVVDLCAVGPRDRTASAVAMSRDGTLILFSDIREAVNPPTIKFKSVKGMAYRVLSAGGYLFVLTSKALHVISGLLEGLGTGKPLQKESPILTIPMEAVDAEVAHDRWVLVTMPRGILVLDIAQLMAAEKPGKPRWDRNTATTLSPDWQSGSVENIGLNRALQETVGATN